MRYICTVAIDAPLNEVVNLWTNEEHFDQWQDGFESIELLEGEKDGIGAKSKITIQQGKRKLELIETILVQNLPTERKALYEHVHMVNTQSSRFEKISADKTRYTSEVEYTQFNGFMPKLLAKLLPGMFEKQSLKWMNQFKDFAEFTYAQNQED